MYRKNSTLFTWQQVCFGVALPLSSGALIQSFLLSFGISSVAVGVFTSLYSMVQVFTMLLCIVVADRIRNLKMAYAWCTLPQIPFYILMALFCLHRSGAKTVLLTADISIAVASLFIGVNCVLVYKLPYLLIDMKNYGKVLSVIGVFSGIGGVLFSVGLEYLIGKFPYYAVMFGAFLFCGVLLIVAFVLNCRFKIFRIPGQVSEEKVPFWQVLKHRSFLVMVGPNLVRGIGYGVLAMLPVFAVHDFAATEKMTALLVVIINIANILSSALLLVLLKRFSSRTLCFWFSSVLAVTLALLGFSKSWVFYLIVFAVLNCGNCAFNYAAPVFFSEIVPFEIMGGYTSIRMILTTGGTALGSLICGLLIDRVPTVWILLIFAALQFVCGAVFGLYPRIERRFASPKTE